VEDGNVESLGCYSAQARVGIAEDEQRIRLDVDHQLVGAVDDVAYRCAKVISDGIHIYLRVAEFEVLEEHAVEVVVVVLACVSKNNVKILAALVDGCGQPDNLRARAYDYQQLEFAIVGKVYVFIIKLHFYILSAFVLNRQNDKVRKIVTDKNIHKETSVLYCFKVQRTLLWTMYKSNDITPSIDGTFISQVLNDIANINVPIRNALIALCPATLVS